MLKAAFLDFVGEGVRVDITRRNHEVNHKLSAISSEEVRMSKDALVHSSDLLSVQLKGN